MDKKNFSRYRPRTRIKSTGGTVPAGPPAGQSPTTQNIIAPTWTTIDPNWFTGGEGSADSPMWPIGYFTTNVVLNDSNSTITTMSEV